MVALVTGASGFLAGYIIDQLLARGERVRGLCRRNDPRLQEQQVELVLGDVRDPHALAEACAGVETVFHVAALTGMWGRWKDFHQTNTLGTRRVLEACIQQRVSQLVYTSSPSVVFTGHDQHGIDESAPYPRRWLCHYSHTKALGEQEVLAAHGQYGLRTCALRPHLVWGPRDRKLVPGILAGARAGRLRRIGDGTNRIDMVYVENAAAAHLQAADALRTSNEVGGRAYFISQGEPVNCWEWIDELLALDGLPPVRGAISASAAWRIGAVLEAIFKTLRLPGEPPLTRFLAAQLSSSHWYDIRRARRDFGYVPHVSTAEGMRRLAAWLAHPIPDPT